MKGSVFSVLEDFEKLIYKILMWIILIPKTIIKITINPKWAPGYITGELDESDPKSHGQLQFDEYISPVILLLVVALLPALAFGLLPKFGTGLTSSATDIQTNDRFISFDAQTEFISASSGYKYSHFWIVEQTQNDGGYKLLSQELHNEYSEKNYLEVVGNHTVRDKFLYTFNDPGEYLVTVIAEKYDPDREDQKSVELYSASITVKVPGDIAEPIVILDTKAKTSSAPENRQSEDFTSRVAQEDTLFLALALMIPPLLFAFAIQIRTKEGRANIGEKTLKESFYAQCYYFSPLSMSIWATYYALYFLTSDVFFYWDFSVSLIILIFPVLLAVLWFFRTEMQIIMGEAGTETPKAAYDKSEIKLSSVDAFFIVVVCLLILGVGAWVLFKFQTVEDWLRVTGIRLYPVVAIFLIAGFGYAWYQRRLEEKKQLTIRNFGWSIAGIAMLFVAGLVIRFILFPKPALSTGGAPGTAVAVAPVDTATLIPIATAIVTNTFEPTATESLAAPSATPLPQSVDATPSAEIPTSTPEPTSTPLPTSTPEPQKFYTEDFSHDLVGWTEFLSSGDPKMLQRHFEPGRFFVELLQLEDRLARYYLINDNFTYSDVKVEAVVVNRGNNTNGVSLVCRYSDVGWYEFLVSNGGTYSVYAFDRTGIINQGYSLISLGTSVRITSGPGATNVYGLACKGTELDFFINHELVDSITDSKFQFQDGKIGIGVSSPEKLPVNIEFNSITVSEP